MNEDLPSVRTQVEQHYFIVQGCHIQLVFHSLVVEAAGELLLLLVLVGGVLFVLLGAGHEHLDVLVEDAGCDLDVCESLGRALEVVEGTLAEAGLDLALDGADGGATDHGGLGVHGGLGAGALDAVASVFRLGAICVVDLCVELDDFAFVVSLFV